MAGSKHLSVDTKTSKVTDPVLNLIDVLLTLGGFTIDSSAEVKTINLGAISGVKVGATGDKIGFLGATPVIQPTGNVLSALALLGLIASPSLTIANITALQAALDLKAGLDSPVLAGTPTAPTPINATSSTQVATTAFVHALLTDLLNASPATLDTLKELADAIGDDPNFAVTVGNLVATKLAKASNLSDLTDVVAARGNLGLGSVNNTSDANKPVSTAQQAALDLKAALAAANIFPLLQTFNSIAASSIVTSQLPNPGAPTVTPIGNDEGAPWSYKIVAKLSDGTPSAAGPAGTTTHGDQTLDATNKNSLAWPAVPGAASYDVYRTAVGTSPSTTGKIANVNTNAYVDTGAAGDSSTPPSTNATGSVRIPTPGGSRTLAEIIGDAINVKNYGLLADDTFDNSAKLAQVISDAPAGATIYFPQGANYYYFASNISVTKPLTFIGDGPIASMLRFAIGQSGFVIAQGLNNVRFEDLCLRTYNKTAGTAGVKAIAPDLAHGIGYLRIRNVEITGFARGLDFEYCQFASAAQCHIYMNDVGIYTKRCLNNEFHENVIELNDTWGARIDGDSAFVSLSAGTQFFGGRMTNNGASSGGNLKVYANEGTYVNGGIYDVPATGSAHNIIFDTCSRGGVVNAWVGAGYINLELVGSSWLEVYGCTIVASAAYGLQLSAADHCLVSENTFSNNGNVDVYISGASESNSITSNDLLSTAAASIQEITESHTLAKNNNANGDILVFPTSTDLLNTRLGTRQTISSSPMYFVNLFVSSLISMGNALGPIYVFEDGVIKEGLKKDAGGDVRIFSAWNGVGGGNDLVFGRRSTVDGTFTESFRISGATGRIVQENWAAPALLNSWANAGAPYQTVGYYKDRTGRVWLRGTITGGATAVDTIIFTLPSGYRPTALEFFPSISSGAFGEIQIDASGNVRVGLATGSLNLNGISFRID